MGLDSPWFLQSQAIYFFELTKDSASIFIFFCSLLITAERESDGARVYIQLLKWIRDFLVDFLVMALGEVLLLARVFHIDYSKL